MLPGPTILIEQGDRLSISYENALTAPAGPNGHNIYHHPNTTNLHLHGLHVSPRAPADDVLGTVVGPSQSTQYLYRILADHSPGTYWAHPHYHGSTLIQAGGGAALPLIIRDPPGYLSSQLSSLKEHILMFQHLPLAKLEKAANISHDKLFRDQRVLSNPDLWLVNGAPKPVLTMRPNEWRRLRLVLAGVGTWLYLDFGRCDVALLAKDGIYIDDFPRFVQRVSLPPGGRADVVVRCLHGSSENSFEETLLSRPNNQGAGSYDGPLLRLRTEGTMLPAVTLMPWRPAARPTYLQDLRGDLVSPDCSCSTVFGPGPNDRFVSGHMYEGARRYLHQWPRDAVVERRLSGMDQHSFHQHTWPFQLLNAPAGDDPYFKAGDWHDTYQNVQDAEAVVRFSTVDFAGTAVVHCHALTHSDQGMMGVELVRGRGPTACACDLLGEAVQSDDGGIPAGPSASLVRVATLALMAMAALLLGILAQVTRLCKKDHPEEYLRMDEAGQPVKALQP